MTAEVHKHPGLALCAGNDIIHLRQGFKKKKRRYRVLEDILDTCGGILLVKSYWKEAPAP